MKTNLQNVRFIIFTIAAVLAIQPVFAQTPTNVIVVTEDSSTSLTATYTLANGTVEPVTVNLIGTQKWDVAFPSSVSFFVPNVGFAWSEPDNSGLANAVNFGANLPNHFTVSSDVSSNFSPITDEGTVANVGTDSSNMGTISLTFDDDAATAEATVPDTGSTLGLLALALAALFGASRFRALRLA